MGEPTDEQLEESERWMRQHLDEFVPIEVPHRSYESFLREQERRLAHHWSAPPEP